MICMSAERDYSILKNLNSLYPQISKKFIKMRLRFIELEKTLTKKSFSIFG
jgi:hypothetical protein